MRFREPGGAVDAHDPGRSGTVQSFGSAEAAASRSRRVRSTRRRMSIIKLPSGRWRAVLKAGREYVGGRTFDT